MSDSASEPARFRDLTLLRENERNYPQEPGEARLECFENRYRHRSYWISFECPEFTSRCPVTNQPDFGHLTIRYIPDATCIESKSLKLYLFAFRNHNTFHEEVVNRILEDVVAACSPREVAVEGHFNPRGGIRIHVSAAWKSAEARESPPPPTP